MGTGHKDDCCTGFMDYGHVRPSNWSECSVRDFEQYYVIREWHQCMNKEITSNDVSNDGSCEGGKLLKCSEHDARLSCDEGCQEVRTLDDVIMVDKETFIRFADANIDFDLGISGSSRCYKECWKDCKPCKISWQWFGRRPVDCEWGSWSEYSLCSNSCGRGEMTRTRSVIKKAKYGGRCTGKSTDTDICNNVNPSLCPVPDDHRHTKKGVRCYNDGICTHWCSPLIIDYCGYFCYIDEHNHWDWCNSGVRESLD